jgi:hypothetical protein
VWVTLLVVVGSVLLVVSGFVWTARRDALERARRIGRLAVGPIADARPGRLVAVRGRLRPVPPTTDPVTEREVAYYEARVLRLDGGERVLHEETRGRALELADESGSLVVELAGAEVDLPLEVAERTDGRPSATMRALLEAGEVEIPEEAPEARYVLEHRALEAGDELVAVGVLREGGLSTTAGLLYLSQGPLAGLQRREREAVQAMGRMLAVAAALGAALLVVGGWLMLGQA